MSSEIKRTNALYAGLSVEVQRELSQYEDSAIFPAGAKLVEEGHSPDCLFIIDSGKAKSSIQLHKRHIEITGMGPGSVCGLDSIISKEATNTTVTCLSECQVRMLPGKAFRETLGCHPEIHFAVVKVLSAELAAADHVLHEYVRVRTSKLVRRRDSLLQLCA